MTVQGDEGFLNRDELRLAPLRMMAFAGAGAFFLEIEEEALRLLGATVTVFFCFCFCFCFCCCFGTLITTGFFLLVTGLDFFPAGSSAWMSRIIFMFVCVFFSFHKKKDKRTNRDYLFIFPDTKKFLAHSYHLLLFSRMMVYSPGSSDVASLSRGWIRTVMSAQSSPINISSLFSSLSSVAISGTSNVSLTKMI